MNDDADMTPERKLRTLRRANKLVAMTIDANFERLAAFYAVRHDMPYAAAKQRVNAALRVMMLLDADLKDQSEGAWNE